MISRRFILNALVVAHHTYLRVFVGFYGNPKIDDPNVMFMQEHEYQLFSTWNLLSQLLYAILVMVSEVQDSYNKNNIYKETIRKIQTYFLFIIVFPSAVFVALFFWMLWYIDDNLLCAKTIALEPPLWMDHCVHTNILLLPFFELFFNKNIPNYMLVCLGSTLYWNLYAITVVCTYLATSRWLYNVAAVLDWQSKIIFHIFMNFIFVGSAYLAVKLQEYIHKNEYEYATRTSVSKNK